MVLNCWKRLFAFVAFVAVFGVCWNTSTVTFVPQAFAADQAPVLVLSPENAKAVGDTVRMQDLANKLAECKASEAGLTKDCKQLNEAYVQALGICRPGCDPKYFLEHRECPPTASVGTSPVAKALNAGKTVRVVRCLPPAQVRNGVCWCDPDQVADEEIGAAPNGDVVTARLVGSKEAGCVNTFETFKQHVVRDNKTLRWVCRADEYKMTKKEKAWFGNHSEWLRKQGIDPDFHLDPNDPRCQETGMHIVYLLGLAEEFERNPNSMPTALQTPRAQEHMQGLAAFLEILQDHENRIFALEQKGTHVQLLGTGFYNLRPTNGAPDTYGLMFNANIIYKFNQKNGVMFGFGTGYGKQPHSEEMMWRASVEWYRLLNSTSHGPKKLTLDESEPPASTELSANSSTLYAMHLGGCIEGGWLLKNVQDEMGGGACGGFQIIPGGTFTIDMSAILGYGRHGLYEGNTRIGYSALHPFIGLSLGLGANIF